MFTDSARRYENENVSSFSMSRMSVPRHSFHLIETTNYGSFILHIPYRSKEQTGRYYSEYLKYIYMIISISLNIRNKKKKII